MYNRTINWEAYLNRYGFKDEVSRGFIRNSAPPITASMFIVPISTLAMIASPQEIQFVLTHNLAAATYAIDPFTVTLESLRSNFDWAMGSILWKLELQRTGLQELSSSLRPLSDRGLAETRRKAEAAFQAGHYSEALTGLLECESKDFQDFSLHLTIGNIYLYHQRPANLEKARASYVVAARYADPRAPRYACLAHLWASFVAYLQNDPESAIDLAQRAINISPQFLEARYSQARYAALAGQTQLVLGNLEQAIRADRNYAIRAVTNNDFANLASQISALIEQLRLDARQQGEIVGRNLYAEIGRSQIPSSDQTASQRLQAEITERWRQDTYFGYMEAAGKTVRYKVFVEGLSLPDRDRLGAETTELVEALKKDLAHARLTTGLTTKFQDLLDACDANLRPHLAPKTPPPAATATAPDPANEIKDDPEAAPVEINPEPAPAQSSAPEDSLVEPGVEQPGSGPSQLISAAEPTGETSLASEAEETYPAPVDEEKLSGESEPEVSSESDTTRAVSAEPESGLVEQSVDPEPVLGGSPTLVEPIESVQPAANQATPTVQPTPSPAAAPSETPLPAQPIYGVPSLAQVMTALEIIRRAHALWQTATHRNVLAGHTGEINGLAFSPQKDASPVVLASSGSWDQSVRLWDPLNGDNLAILNGHEDSVNSIAFSPDGSLLASGGGIYKGQDFTIRLWDLASRQSLAILDFHTQMVNQVAFDPQGKRLASCSGDGRVCLWSVETYEKLAVLDGHIGSASSLAFSPNGWLLATAGEDQAVRLWNIDTAKQIGVLLGHAGAVTSIHFTPDSHRLVSRGTDQTLRLWDIEHQSLIKVMEQPGQVTALAISPRGNQLAWSIGDDPIVRMWGMDSEDDPTELIGHTSPVSGLAFNQDGSLLASGGSDGLVRLWDSQTGQALAIRTGHTERVIALAFSPDDSVLATGGHDHKIRVWGIALTASDAEAIAGESRQRQQKIEDEREAVTAEQQRQTWLASGCCEICGTRLSLTDRITRQTRCKNHRKGK